MELRWLADTTIGVYLNAEDLETGDELHGHGLHREPPDPGTHLHPDERISEHSSAENGNRAGRLHGHRRGRQYSAAPGRKDQRFRARIAYPLRLFDDYGP